MIQVAAYCRVSTDHEDQANSFANQKLYFKEYIDRRPEWTLYQIYADEGITGTSTKNRSAFNCMIEAAHQGNFQLILTKEVSRFSRNILDTITYTRDLKALGIGVIFVNDNINTLEPDAELRLSIMASLAQEESRKTSSRVKWGQTRRMEQGIVFGRSLLGYSVKGGYLTINPKEAEIVKVIFSKYGLEKKGTTVIARELCEAGYLTHSGNAKWSSSHIVKILKNEKYVGDLIQKKTFTPDYLSHVKKPNHGEEELVILTGHHEPIIDRQLWDLVQSELKKRRRNNNWGIGHSNRYMLSGKIKCGQCGASFVARKKIRRDGTFYRYWSCYTTVSQGGRRIDVQNREIGCDVGKAIREELVMEMLHQSLTALQLQREEITQNVTDLVLEAVKAAETGYEASLKSLKSKITQLCQKKTHALDAFFSGEISKEDFTLVNTQYEQELTVLRKRLAEMSAMEEYAVHERLSAEESIYQQIALIVDGKSNSEVFWKNILDHVVVCKDKKMEIYLNALSHKLAFRIAST